jgi:hypothetical protein
MTGCKKKCAFSFAKAGKWSARSWRRFPSDRPKKGFLISTATQIGGNDFLRMAPKHASAVPSGRAFGGLGDKNEKKRKKSIDVFAGCVYFLLVASRQRRSDHFALGFGFFLGFLIGPLHFYPDGLFFYGQPYFVSEGRFSWHFFFSTAG